MLKMHCMLHMLGMHSSQNPGMLSNKTLNSPASVNRCQADTTAAEPCFVLLQSTYQWSIFGAQVHGRTAVSQWHVTVIPIVWLVDTPMALRVF